MALEQPLSSVANEVFLLVADGDLFLNWLEQGYFFSFSAMVMISRRQASIEC